MSYFGTDGIRGTFGQFPITPDFIMTLGYVTGQVLVDANKSADDDNTNYKKPSVVIGKDTRLSGDIVESALQAGFNSAGVDVYYLGQLPTPAISHLTRSYQADAGVVISASHNPYYDNGIKFFSAEGKKFSDKMQQQINKKLESYLKKQAKLATQIVKKDNTKKINGLMQADPAMLGRGYVVSGVASRYIEYCKGTFPYQLSLRGIKIVIDCANGAGFAVAPRILQELGAEVIAIHDMPNGLNINEQCGSTHPESLQQAVIAHQADVGMALDGDSDRIIMVDEQGSLLDGDALLYILATYSDEKPKGVVGTLMTNMALELAFAQFDIGFVRAKVGDRYVMQELEKNGWLLGGENSGHILCLDKSRTGDAIVAGLQVLAVMVKQKQSMSQLIKSFELLPQTLINVKLNEMSDPYDFPELVAEFEATEKLLAGKGRLLIRKSGTEPVIRVMVEGEDEKKCRKLAIRLAKKVKSVLQPE